MNTQGWGTYNNQKTAHSWGVPLYEFPRLSVFSLCGKYISVVEPMKPAGDEKRCKVCSAPPSKMYVRKVSPCDEEAGSTGKVTT